MEREWWVDDSGINTLKGVPGDPTNPPMLREDYIFDFLRKIPAARDSYNRIYPTLLPEEKARLDLIVDGGALFLQPDIQGTEDNFQRRQNTAGIFTTGRFGGTRYGGNSQ